MEHKISDIGSTKVLDESKGIVEAWVNTMGVIDKDGDIIRPGAFDSSLGNLPIPVLSGHNQNDIVGKVVGAATLPVDGENPEGPHRLHATIQMNLDTQSGREAFSNVSGDYIREWSVGFNMPPDGAKVENIDGHPVRIIEDVDWVETSTVVRGASPDTQTISSKSENMVDEKDAIPPHKTDTTTGPWDSGEMVRRIPNDIPASEFKEMYAYVDPEKNEDTKQAYKFPHHDVSETGNIGAANIRGCQAAIAALNGARGGADVPAVDRRGIWKHVAAHMDDAGMTAPDLRVTSTASDTTDQVASDTGSDDAILRFVLATARLTLLRLKLRLKK
jgi:HK97 family phage prohead protease